MMDLFSYQQDAQPQGRLLADRMRPEQLDEYIGQEHIIGPGKLLRGRLRPIRCRRFCCTVLQAAGRQRWLTSYRGIHKDNSCGSMLSMPL